MIQHAQIALTFIDHTPMRVTLYYGQSVTVCCNARTMKFSFVNKKKTLVLLFEEKKYVFILCGKNIRFFNSLPNGCNFILSEDMQDSYCIGR